MKTTLIIGIIVMFLIAGCSDGGNVVVPKSKYDFNKAMEDLKSVEDKYDVVDDKVLPQNYEGLIFDLEGLEAKLESMDSSQDVKAAILLVKFKLNLFRSKDLMRMSSFEVTEDICDRLNEFTETYNTAMESVKLGRESINNLDAFIMEYPEHLKKINSEQYLSIREDLESDINQLERNTESIKDYSNTVC